MIGLYKSAGVELVRQQIENLFAPLPRYKVTAEGLVLWPDREADGEVLYDLHAGPWIGPRPIQGRVRRLLPTVEQRQLAFSEVAVPWDDWVVVWNQDMAGQGHPREPIVPVHVLP